MVANAKDLRFNISQLFSILNKGEEITITYRGKPKAKLVPISKNTATKDDSIFGMHSDQLHSIDDQVRALRKARVFDV